VTGYTFNGRVAVVTGAGRGIGRSYASLLAARGASVVVNDLGGSVEGGGADESVARAAADEIVAAGGEAIADANDVSSVEGSEALIDAACERFGRVDVLVNNAGIVRWAGMPEVDAENLLAHLAVHVVGSFNTTRAAWPHMAAQGYGRVVMTASTGMFGLAGNPSYATAKAGVIGLARSLAVAGVAHGIKVNCVAPAAMTRMAGRGAAEPEPEMSPDLVAPLVGFLAHEDCPVTGDVLVAGFGRFGRLFVAATPGYVHPTPDVAIEDVAAHWDAIRDESGYTVPADLPEWSAAFMAHLGP
jgi:NAD(P)-dependent dehydrogenase (short-subunit alcohol dehydrogenase family)